MLITHHNCGGCFQTILLVLLLNKQGTRNAASFKSVSSATSSFQKHGGCRIYTKFSQIDNTKKNHNQIADTLGNMLVFQN